MRQKETRRFRPEVELLLSCAREQIFDSQDGRATVSTFDNLDWGTVLNLARRHRLQPFVYRSLTNQDVSLPSDVWNDLENTSQALVRRNLSMVSELSDLLNQLEEGGVRTLVYKGPSLAELAYDDITLRKFVDLDLLVPEEDFSKAVDILCADTYVVEDSFPVFGEKTLRERDTEITIDLHFRVTPARYPFTFPFNKLWERRIEVSICGKKAPTLSPKDLLPVIAVHGTRHFWIQLEWLVSFAALIYRKSINLAGVLRRSKQIGCDRMVLLGLKLSQELMGFSFSKKISTSIDNEWTVQLVSKRVISQVVRRDVSYSISNRSFHYERYLAQLALMRGLHARKKYGFRIGNSLIRNKIDLINPPLI